MIDEKQGGIPVEPPVPITPVLPGIAISSPPSPTANIEAMGWMFCSIKCQVNYSHFFIFTAANFFESIIIKGFSIVLSRQGSCFDFFVVLND